MERVEFDAQALLQALREKDAETLLRLLNDADGGRTLDKGHVETIIAGFEANFSLETLNAQLYEEGYAMSPESG